MCLVSPSVDTCIVVLLDSPSSISAAGPDSAQAGPPGLVMGRNHSTVWSARPVQILGVGEDRLEERGRCVLINCMGHIQYIHRMTCASIVCYSFIQIILKSDLLRFSVF